MLCLSFMGPHLARGVTQISLVPVSSGPILCTMQFSRSWAPLLEWPARVPFLSDFLRCVSDISPWVERVPEDIRGPDESPFLKLRVRDRSSFLMLTKGEVAKQTISSLKSLLFLKLFFIVLSNCFEGQQWVSS